MPVARPFKFPDASHALCGDHSHILYIYTLTSCLQRQSDIFRWAIKLKYKMLCPSARCWWYCLYAYFYIHLIYEWYTWAGSAAVMAWLAFRASRQMSSWPVMMRWLTMRLREQRWLCLDDSAEVTVSNQSAAAAWLSTSLRSIDTATLSSWYQELTGSSRNEPYWRKETKEFNLDAFSLYTVIYGSTHKKIKKRTCEMENIKT